MFVVVVVVVVVVVAVVAVVVSPGASLADPLDMDAMVQGQDLRTPRHTCRGATVKTPQGIT